MKFSIITISFNAQEEIERTILSVYQQNFTDYEYILIDGGSTDNTIEIIKKNALAFKDKGIRYFYRSEKDEGISDAFNKGIAQARGDMIALINAGDMLKKDALTRICAQMEDSTDVLYGNIIWIEQNGQERIRKPKRELKNLMYEMVLMHPATFIKRETYERNGFYRKDFKYAMDQELLCRLYINNSVFQYVDDEFAVMSAGGVSDKKTWEVLKETNKIPMLYGKNGVKTHMFFFYKYLKNRLSKSYRKIIYTVRGR